MNMTTPQEVHARSLPAFVCHFYNHYFAHTAGGRMIGKKMAAMLLEGHELHFYQVGAVADLVGCSVG